MTCCTQYNAASMAKPVDPAEPPKCPICGKDMERVMIPKIGAIIPSMLAKLTCKICNYVRG